MQRLPISKVREGIYIKEGAALNGLQQHKRKRQSLYTLLPPLEGQTRVLNHMYQQTGMEQSVSEKLKACFFFSPGLAC